MNDDRTIKPRTQRGFPPTTCLPEQIDDVNDEFFVVRLTRWEYRQLRGGIKGKFTIMGGRGDGTYDLVVSELDE